MPSAKRNDWLHSTSDHEDSESGYDSEAAEETKDVRAAKRRRLSTPREDEDDASDDGAAAHDVSEETTVIGAVHNQEQDSEHTKYEEKKDSERDSGHIPGQESPRRIRVPEMEFRQLTKPNKSAASKTGVIYLSRIPPFMKPQTVKHLLEPYGEIGRIFLTPEDPASHTKRVKSGGNKKRSFIDGWVEFHHKKDAKVVAETLNARIIGGKKGGWYHDDVWNIKYLKGFKWLHLTEQIANENAERTARLRAEISQTSKENKRFVANVERAKKLEGMRAKRKQRTSKQNLLQEMIPQDKEEKIKQSKSSFRQNEVRTKSGPDKGNEAAVHRVLSKIF